MEKTKITEIKVDGYHRVIRAENQDIDFLAFIAVHNVNLGPSLGGLRVLPYLDDNSQLTDTLFLARGMTYKSALAGNKLGGGKATIKGPLTSEKLLAFSHALNYINKDTPTYYTAADVGTNNQILSELAKVSKFVNFRGQDCSIATAFGVFYAMRGACDFLDRDLLNENVSIVGFGKVGRRLGNILNGHQIQIIASDVAEIFPANSFGHKKGLIPDLRGTSDVRTAHRKGTILSPCALGGYITKEIISDLPNGHLICGAANNQLFSASIETDMISKDITYVPDFVANSGGVIITAEQNSELYDLDFNDPLVLPRLKKIRYVVKDLLERARSEKLSTVAMAERIAEEAFNGK